MPILYVCDICQQRIPGNMQTKVFKVKVIVGIGTLHDFAVHDSDIEKEFDIVCEPCMNRFMAPDNPYDTRSHRD